MALGITPLLPWLEQHFVWQQPGVSRGSVYVHAEKMNCKQVLSCLSCLNTNVAYVVWIPIKKYPDSRAKGSDINENIQAVRKNWPGLGDLREGRVWGTIKIRALLLAESQDGDLETLPAPGIRRYNANSISYWGMSCILNDDVPVSLNNNLPNSLWLCIMKKNY